MSVSVKDQTLEGTGGRDQHIYFSLFHKLECLLSPGRLGNVEHGAPGEAGQLTSQQPQVLGSQLLL